MSHTRDRGIDPEAQKLGVYIEKKSGDRGNWRGYTQLDSLNISKRYLRVGTTATLEGGCLSMSAEHLVKLKPYQKETRTGGPISTGPVQRLFLHASYLYGKSVPGMT